ncbi:hypothetical protein [Lentibacillus cibarius]|uniref:Uncharacterized protein n=1 Tax=Lentibacillus cibarius TaxID=2583219 RepID=A0A5S3QJF1_9BACI|nr:hypothetical protein [Lentibacillus cibarius]TMN21857.1 hypothetical protein FFL34_06815 [Lentibacillus cibarius]
MDKRLLEEHLEEMQPYLLKWFREYNVMLLTSPFKTLEYEVFMDGFAPAKDMLCQSYLYSISEAFKELVKTYYYSLSAYAIEKKLREEGEIGWSNYWKYEVKNYYFRSIIPRFISLLDYVAVMVNELSQRKLISNIRRVYFNGIKSVLEIRKEGAGWLTYEDIKELSKILSYAYRDINEEEKDVLKLYRNTTTHRYFVGIDELTVPIQRRKITEQEQELYKIRDNYSYRVTGKPDYTFEKLNETIEKLMNNLDFMISQLMEMDFMQNVVTRIVKE